MTGGSQVSTRSAVSGALTSTRTMHAWREVDAALEGGDR